MKVVTAEIMQQIDRRAIEEFGVPGLTLMENAGRGCAEAVIAEFGDLPVRQAVVVAGKGNNGGDGYVIARHLLEKGWRAKVFVLARKDEISGDARANLDRLRRSTITFCPEPGGLRSFASDLREATVIVDAMFGTGLKSEVRGAYRKAIELVNAAGRPVVAVDIPSGIHGSSGRMMGSAVRADVTVTFAVAKLGHVLYPGAEYAGRLRVSDIGIPAEVTAMAAGYDFLDADDGRQLVKRRERTSHKGSFGHSLIVAGSTGKTGAAAMAANSAVRAGSGLVTLAVPAGLNHILEVKTTEAMTLPLPDDGMGYLGPVAHGDLVKALAGKDAVALGPGISWRPETAQLVRRLAAEITLPLVIDADGLNAVSEDPSVLLRKKTDTVILTPHPGEMARLAGIETAAVEADRIGVACEFAAKYRVFLVLKGARTIIAAPDGGVAINGSGNPGMASGGMGDVLTGVLVALLAQGYDPFQACKLGVFIHGYAADLVAADKGEIGMSAVDVQERLPYAYKQLLTAG
ncbi:MAG: hypothetical protein FD174_1458 [Geobacteraceae bacterium]|nr:MAG: hypothetical protein FD174_1458 [Geobacteraceae bacterium]